MATRLINLTVTENIDLGDGTGEVARMPIAADSDALLIDSISITNAEYTDCTNSWGMKDSINIYKTFTSTVLDGFGASDKRRQKAQLVANMEDSIALKDLPAEVENIGYIAHICEGLTLQESLELEAQALVAGSETITYTDLVAIKPDYFVCPNCGWTTRPKRPKRPHIQPLGNRRYMIFGS